MDVLVLALFVPVVLIAGFVRGLTGFGGPLILVPIFILFVDPPTAAAIVMLVDICGNIGILKEAVRDASWRTVIFTVLSACAAMPLGSYMMLSTEPDVVRSTIYLAVGGAAVILMFGIRFPRPLRSYELAGGGAVAGGVMGATALGIVIVPILFSSPDNAQTSRANLIVWIFFVSLVLVALLFAGGGVGSSELLQGIALAPAYSIGALLGKKYFGRLDEHRFRRYVLLFLCAMSIAGLTLT